LNRAAQQSWPLWKSISVRLIHQTGMRAFEEFEPLFKAAKVQGEILPFFDDMALRFAEADLIVSRSGMGTVSEIAAAGKPSILVPLPTASDQHQLHNALAFERAGAAKMILDTEMTGERLVEEVNRMTSESGLLSRMGQAARDFSKPGGAKRAAEVLEGLAK
jgi:UDP-N-acetylglucosamine--N-acetylmuramyl-(pentapeptide) pyrophosphoryl-undecaprenol N-acetylglucosamine transferase